MNHIAVHLREIFFNKKTGRLIFKRGDVLKYFYFAEGAIFQVKTNRPEERLGEILLQLGRIPKDAHARIEDYIEPNASIGEVLKTRGMISEEDLAEALAQQIRESILNVFGAFDAEMDFQPHEKYVASTGAESRVSVPLLIEYGIRRMTATPALQAGLAHLKPALGRKTYAYLLTLEEKELLEKINGSDTAAEILRGLALPPEPFYKSLYLFYCLGVVDLPGLGEAAPPPDVKSRLQRPGAVSKDVPQAVAEVMAFRDMLPAMTLYQILDVPKTATEEDIKKAYFALARRFHPDRFDRHIVTEFKSQIDEVFDGINNAYKVLSNKDSRRVYDAKVGTGQTQEDVQDTFRKADIKFRQGKTLHGQGRYDEAIAYLEEAVRIRRDKGDYYLLLAMCESRLPAYVKKAEQDFLKAIQLEPWNPEGYVGLGLLYKAEGMQTRAIKQLEKALEVEPDHASARDALNELTGGAKKGQKSFFSLDLFGSKKKKK